MSTDQTIDSRAQAVLEETEAAEKMRHQGDLMSPIWDAHRQVNRARRDLSAFIDARELNIDCGDDFPGSYGADLLELAEDFRAVAEQLTKAASQ